ncbi:MAG: o-succinylbenzoate synthase [Actinomycetota bacterium]
MRITAIELRRVRLPFLRPLRTALGEHSVRDVLLVRVATPEAEGWGECAALDGPSYTAEYVDGAAAVLRHHLVPRLLAAGDVDADGVGPALAGVRGHRMAKAALEMAVLDAGLRAAARSLADELGATAATVEAGVAVGMAASLPELVDAVAEAVDAGYRRVKLKIAPGWDVEPVRAVRERFGDGLLLQADANGAYRLADAGHLARLDPFDLVLLEQPLGPEDLVGHAELARRIATPVCLDESIISVDAAAAALALGAAGVVSVKPGRVGGYLEARRIHDLCRAAGVPVWCGGMFETGLARAANLALAALPGFTLPGDVAPPSWYLAGDIVRSPLTAVGGRMGVPDTPGIGAEIDERALARHGVPT